MTNLKQARESGKLAQFVKDHKGEQGNPDEFNRTVASMAQTSPEVPKASDRPDHDD